MAAGQLSYLACRRQYPRVCLARIFPDHRVALRMNVVVGKAVRNETPVFAKDMKYIVFRPYWNVPYSITRGEIIPALDQRQRLPGAQEL